MMQPAEQLPWELEEKIQSLLPRKIQARFRSVCKRWNGVFDERRFFNNVLGPARDAFVVGAVHGNTTQFPYYQNFIIAEDDYIEAVEGTYNESHITSIAFRTHKRKHTPHYGLFEGRFFTLGGGGDSKIIGFYGKNSPLHLTALGVHL
ncbi:unnamed protein product [Microthlaspi erraticum]|uniref:Jacalin-type lectin domain-containing protein n=1 Tax=Microthlaspi erraticum TaxID=1685480 RepID=A0A6D2HJR7_9BRAS|nr:unnamed protein product [Microthlaspi erraticum]